MFIQKKPHKKDLSMGEELIEAMRDTMKSLKKGDYKII